MDFHCRVILTCVNKRNTLYARPRENVKVASEFFFLLLDATFRYFASNLFMHVNTTPQ